METGIPGTREPRALNRIQGTRTKNDARCECEEGLFDVDVALGRRFEESQTKLVGQLLSLLFRDDLRAAPSEVE